MLKPIFDEDVDFFSKKIILCAKGGDFNMGQISLIYKVQWWQKSECNAPFLKSPPLAR